MRVVFMGSSEFGIPALEGLNKNGHSVVGIVSTPAKQKGRGLMLADSPVVEYARKKGLGPVFTPQTLSSDLFVEELKRLSADIFVVIAFRILPKNVFNIPLRGTYNVHASLLPRYRGPAPIQRAIAAGEKETGVTIFRIEQGVDTGAIVLAKKIAIGGEETTPQLSIRLSQLGAAALVEALSLIGNNKAVFAGQDGSLACGAPKLSKAEGKIRWELPAPQIYNMIRAFKPFPGTYSFYDTLRIGIEWGIVLPDSGPRLLEPGTICGVSREGFDVQCGLGRLRVLSVKPEGKTTMSAGDFINGRGVKEGMRLA